MKFFHLSDLHIGKQLHHYNLREDQEYILAEVLSYAASIHPDAIVIAGDIYDKSVPSAEAVGLFDEFLTALAKIEPSIPVLIISGNHDSAQRLDYASRLLGSHQIYIAGQAPEEEEDRLKKDMCARSLAEMCRRVIRQLYKEFWNGRRLIFPEEMYWFPISFIQGRGRLQQRVNQKYYLSEELIM